MTPRITSTMPMSFTRSSSVQQSGAVMRDAPPGPMQTFMRTACDTRQRASVLWEQRGVRTSVYDDKEQTDGVPHPFLRHRETVADRTMAFHFGKPANFHFTAGQSLDLTLITPPQTDAEGNTRKFTIASAPQDDDIVIATRLRDTAFKRVLASVPLGTEVQAEGPDGTFTLQQDASQPAVFLTRDRHHALPEHHSDAVARKLSHPLWLFYSNNRPEDAAFLDELQQLANATSSLHFVPTMTDMAKSHRDWRGQTGLIDREMIRRHVPLLAPRYYLAGPPAMVRAMRTMLTDAKVKDADIQFEEFSGTDDH